VRALSGGGCLSDPAAEVLFVFDRTSERRAADRPGLARAARRVAIPVRRLLLLRSMRDEKKDGEDRRPDPPRPLRSPAWRPREGGSIVLPWAGAQIAGRALSFRGRPHPAGAGP